MDSAQHPEDSESRQKLSEPSDWRRPSEETVSGPGVIVEGGSDVAPSFHADRLVSLHFIIFHFTTEVTSLFHFGLATRDGDG